MFIVQRAESVPCRDAKAVEPSDVPPMKPEYLPRPYGWEVFYRKNDPNNPYNLIHAQPPEPPAPVHRNQDERAEPRRSREQPVNEAGAPGRSTFQSGAAPVARSGERIDGSALDLVDTEVEDLALIVELSQRGAPAAFTDDGSQGRVRLARSLAFEGECESTWPVAAKRAVVPSCSSLLKQIREVRSTGTSPSYKTGWPFIRATTIHTNSE
jgi:hypothetical protein